MIGGFLFYTPYPILGILLGFCVQVSLKMVDRLKAFKQSSKLQRMALLAMSFGSKEDHIAEFDVAFRHIDTVSCH